MGIQNLLQSFLTMLVSNIENMLSTGSEVHQTGSANLSSEPSLIVAQRVSIVNATMFWM